MVIHKHHIIPRHMGGSNNPDNLIELSIAEHAEAHRKLYEEHGRWQDKVAWQGLLGLIGHDEILKEINAARRGENHPFYGKPRSDSTKQKISKSLKGHTVSNSTREIWQQQRTGKVVSEDTKQKISAGNKGKVRSEEHKEKLKIPKSDEHKRKISAGNKGKVRSEEARQKYKLARSGKTDSNETRKKKSQAQKGRNITWDLKATTPEANAKRSKSLTGKSKPVILCPHCGKSGGVPQMKQWHFDNCKRKK